MITDTLMTNGWKTPNTYDGASFSALPPAPGVYLLLHINIRLGDPDFGKERVLYVGMSKNLAKRLLTHEVLYAVPGLYIQKWFIEKPLEDLRIFEREMIEHFDPPFNIIGRRRGL